MTRVGVYLRQSYDPGGDGAAVDRQRTACARLCEARGWHIVDEYADNHVSATSGDRRQWGRLLADARAGRFDVVVAWAVDRLARKPRDLADLIDTGVKAATVQGDLDLTTPQGEATATVLVAMARMEIRQKSARQTLAAAQRAERGLPPIGPRARGWAKDGVTIVEQEAELIRAGYDLIRGGGSIRSVARLWNADGMTTGHGNAYDASAARYVLTNPRYAGLRGVQEGRYQWSIVGPGQWPAIVEEDRWRAVEAILRDPSRRMAPDTRRKHWLSGLAMCGKCGAPVNTGGTQHGVRTYKCSAVKHLARAAEPVDEHVADRLLMYLAREQVVVDGPGDLSALIAEGAGLRAQLDDLAAMLTEGVLTAAGVRAESKRLRARLAGIDGAVAAATRTSALAGLPLDIDALADWWDDPALDIERRRAVLVASGLEVTLHSPGFGRRPFDPLTITITPKETR